MEMLADARYAQAAKSNFSLILRLSDMREMNTEYGRGEKTVLLYAIPARPTFAYSADRILISHYYRADAPRPTAPLMLAPCA